MDLDNGATVVAAYLGSKEVISKLLGPTADYLGEELQGWTKRRAENLGRIFKSAHLMLGDRINEDGSVPSRVLKEILDDGSFAEDALAADYFGGVMASSRTGISRDDRGAAIAQLIASMSTYQIRSHFLIYRAMKESLDGQIPEKDFFASTGAIRIFIPTESYVTQMDLDETERVSEIISHAVIGLYRLQLIEMNYHIGTPENLYYNGYKEATEHGMLISPTERGFELFHWAHGFGHRPVWEFFEPSTHYEATTDVKPLQGIAVVKRPSNAVNDTVDVIVS